MADTNTIFNSKLIDLNRLGEFWTKVKAYIDAADNNADFKFATIDALNALTTKHDNHETAFSEFVDEYTTWQGTVDTHIATGNIHVTAKQKEDWQAATDAINAFLDETATKDEVIDTLKEIQIWLGSGESDAAAGLISRVGALEDKLDGTLGSVVDVAKAISDAIDAHNIAEEAHANRFAAIDEKFNKDYYTKGECDAKFDTIANVSATYATKTEMGEVSAKVDTEVGKVDAKFAGYYTKNEVNTKVGEVSAKVDTEVGKVDAKFAGYYTKNEVDTEVGKVDAKFNKFQIATTAEVEGLFKTTTV